MYTQEDLLAQLKALGVEETDTITAHTSLKAVGALDTSRKTGAEVYLDALKAAVKDGILMIPTHTWANVRQDGDVFDIRETVPCIGAVPAVAARQAGESWEKGDKTCVRTCHPTHSAVIYGKNAAAFGADDIFAATPAPWAGCYGKLFRNHGKILLVGVNQGRNTFFHGVDELLDTPDRLCDSMAKLFVRDYDGTVTPRPLYRHKRSMSDFFMNYEPSLIASGAVKFGRLGDAQVRVCDAVKCAQVIEALWKQADHDICFRYETLPLITL